MRILVNGLGCPYTGSRIVLDQIINAAPQNVEVVVIVPVVKNGRPFKYPSNVKIIPLNHGRWGMYLRIFLELWINFMMMLKRYDLVINVSNYGLCFTRRQVLYIHNQLILDMSAEQKFGGGSPNKLTRNLMNTFLRTGEAIFLQSDHIFQLMKDYCAINKISFPKSVIVLKPPFPDTPLSEGITERHFPFQFFYPASDFPHKRIDLAIGGMREATAINNNTGLVITVDGAKESNIVYLGQVDLARIFAEFRTADALLFTSERETLGLPLLEAMHFEKPAVLPDRSYAHEIYGDAAVYYSDDQFSTIANAINKLVDNYEQLKQRTKQRKQEQIKIRKSWAQHWVSFMQFARSN